MKVLETTGTVNERRRSNKGKGRGGPHERRNKLYKADQTASTSSTRMDELPSLKATKSSTRRSLRATRQRSFTTKFALTEGLAAPTGLALDSQELQSLSVSCKAEASRRSSTRNTIETLVPHLKVPVVDQQA